MASLSFNSRTLHLRPDETVLDCLLRHGEPVPWSCRAGACQACMVQAMNCQATERARGNLRPALQAQGYALACQWIPDSDVAATLPGIERFTIDTSIRELRPLAAGVLAVLLEPVDPATMFACRPGQYVTLTNPAGVTRSYSVANDYERDGVLELHIGATSHGLFTHWVYQVARPGDHLRMRGPAGECRYDAKDVDAHRMPLVLAGTGTGLAPLVGIVRDALHQGHAGAIHLFHAGDTRERLYLMDELRALARTHANFRYYPCVRKDEGEDVHVGPVESTLARHVDPGALARARVYLCGAPAFVHDLRKQLFLRGARASHIHCDPFIEREVQSH